MYSQQVSNLYLHSLMLQQRINQLDTEIRKTARMLAQILDRHSIVSLAWGQDDSEALDLAGWATDLLIYLEDLGSDYNYYTCMFDALLKEDPTLIAA